MDGQPMVFLVLSAPLYGVSGVLYGRLASGGLHVVARPDFAVQYGSPDLATVLASQMIRRLSSFRVLTVDELLHLLEPAA
ncbi:hypothetical protein ABZV29_39300 [Streptomyces sp. NPDC005236]|uniref:hypothetical protein n=1 Tax=Streptomyces sp. NPDC005236 TaxID=3157028 RepID=UPI00339F489F